MAEILGENLSAGSASAGELELGSSAVQSGLAAALRQPDQDPVQGHTVLPSDLRSLSQSRSVSQPLSCLTLPFSKSSG